VIAHHRSAHQAVFKANHNGVHTHVAVTALQAAITATQTHHATKTSHQFIIISKVVFLK